MEKWINIKLVLLLKDFHKLKALTILKPSPESPVAKMNSICLVLSLAASFKWEVHQMDVNFAFLHGELHE